MALLDGTSTISFLLSNNQVITVWGESGLSLQHFWAFAVGGLRGVFCMACGRQRPTGYRRLKPAVPIRIGRLYPREGLPTQMTSCCGSRSPPALLKASMVVAVLSLLQAILQLIALYYLFSRASTQWFNRVQEKARDEPAPGPRQ